MIYYMGPGMYCMIYYMGMGDRLCDILHGVHPRSPPPYPRPHPPPLPAFPRTPRPSPPPPPCQVRVQNFRRALKSAEKRRKAPKRAETRRNAPKRADRRISALREMQKPRAGSTRHAFLRRPFMCSQSLSRAPHLGAGLCYMIYYMVEKCTIRLTIWGAGCSI